VTDHPRRKRALTPEQEAERFTTDGASFDEALALILAGGTGSAADHSADEREADK
jgi:hypothetical protein